MQTESKTYHFESIKSTEVKEENNEEYKPLHMEEIESNLPTPLMFSRCSSLGSLASFEQRSVHDDRSSTISDLSSRPSGITSPLLNSNEPSKPKNRLQISEHINGLEIHQKREHNNVHQKINNPELDNISFQYDTLFKKPHFLKHSVFEDDIAAFKEESSPTIASSLSSLTIDDEDYCDHTVQSKAGLIKKKLNPNSTSEIKNFSVQGCWRQDPIGGTCEPLHTSKVLETKRGSKRNFDKFGTNCLEKQTNSEKSNKCTIRTSLDRQLQKQKENKINETTWNINNIKKYNSNQLNEHYFTNEQSTAEFEPQDNKQFYKNKVNDKYNHEDEHKNIHRSNEKCIHTQNIQSHLYNKSVSNGNKEETYKSQLAEQNKYSQASYKIYNDKLNYNDENNDLNAYEEQLLDQCIRKGMAKVTKRNINDIKPFSWDLNQICLTTRAMIKNRDEIVRDRKDECNKKHIFPKGLTKYATNHKLK